MSEKIYSIYGKKPVEMTKRLLEAAKPQIAQGATIGLKPNLVVAAPPQQGATTHAEILRGVIEYLIDTGHRNICIMEGAWVGASTEEGFDCAGYREVAKQYQIPLMDLKKDKVIAVNTAIGSIKICERALQTDYLINLPVLKGHCQTVMTCALKNCKGCIPDAEKRRFHAMGLHRPIAALAAALKPALTIVDNLCGDLNFEEGGNPVQMDRLLLGFDPVAIDRYACQVMGIDPSEVPYIALAEQFGAGRAEAPEVIELGEVSKTPAMRTSRAAARLTRNVKQDQACSACFGALVYALARMEERGRAKELEKIAIGQGFRGKDIPGLGIGSCCAGAEVCVKGCPPDASAILRAMEAYLNAQEKSRHI